MVNNCGPGKCDGGECEVAGTLIDFVTGQKVPDTIVERVRQRTERFLVEKKGYLKEEIEVGVRFEIELGGAATKLSADLLVRAGDKRAIIIKCTFDALTSKEKLILSYARLLESYQIPFAVVVNIEGARGLDTISGEVIGEGFDAIPSRDELNAAEIEFKEFPKEKVEMQKRVLAAFEALDEGSCHTL